MTTSISPARSFLLASLAIALTGPALAGRPLTVDDAGTNAGGEGHVEVWMARADGAKSYNISPAYALRDGLEISALLSRETSDKVTGTALQLKYLFTPSKERGCNFGAGVGLAHASGAGDGENASFINGIATCNGTPLGNVHFNLGYSKPSSGSGERSWGVALERQIGKLTPHIEYFGVEQTKPVVQVGLRGDVSDAIQLDGTVGRSDGVTAWSLGMKVRF